MRFTTPRRSASSLFSRAGMTGFIDVVFLLLIFFLVTASMAPREEDLASALASDSTEGGRSADLQPIIIEVTRVNDQPRYILNRRVTQSREELKEWLEPLPKETGAFVRVLPQALVADIAAALRTCKDAGFENVTYVPVETP